MYTHTYIHTCMHTYIHTYIHFKVLRYTHTLGRGQRAQVGRADAEAELLAAGGVGGGIYIPGQLLTFFQGCYVLLV